MQRPHLSMTRKQAVEAGQAVARRFDFPLLSKCLKPDVYGIQPVEEIASVIFASESRRIENRALPVRITWRLTESLKTRLQIVKTAYGQDCTFQEFITTAVLNECERIEQKRKEAEHGIAV